MNISIDGKPVNLSWKQILLYVVLGTGIFAGGATYPGLNPLSYFEAPCEVE